MEENIYFLSDKLLLESVGAKIKHWRVEQNITQENLASQSLVSLSTVKKLERGESVSLDKFVRVIRVLRKLEVFDVFIREEEISPALWYKMQSKARPRQRASKSRKP